MESTIPLGLRVAAPMALTAGIGPQYCLPIIGGNDKVSNLVLSKWSVRFNCWNHQGL